MAFLNIYIYIVILKFSHNHKKIQVMDVIFGWNRGLSLGDMWHGLDVGTMWFRFRCHMV
jgi:hypothetical protein